jgi:hypothetical protein
MYRLAGPSASARVWWSVVVEIPVQCLEVAVRLQDDVTEPLYAGGDAPRALGGVETRRRVADVEHVWLLGGQVGHRVHARDDAHRDTARVDEGDADAADGLRECGHRRAGAVGEAQHVDLAVGAERHSGEPAAVAAPQHDARCARVGAAQVQFLGRPQCDLETERPGERLGAEQVRLLELQPGDVGDLDHRGARPAGVFALTWAVLAVQILMHVGAGARRLDRLGHVRSLLD